MKNEIDIVITYVNDADPEWRQQLETYRSSQSLSDHEASQRFSDNGELRFCLRSIELHCPFFRKIHLVTNTATPRWLRLDHPRLAIVSHDEIFPDRSCLPTFHSNAIESCLHRIPNLSEQFLYFNDDTLLAQDIALSDFLDERGRTIVHVENALVWPLARPTVPVWLRGLSSTARALSLAEKFPLPYFLAAHTPAMFNSRKLFHLEERFAERYERCRRSRFRSRDSFAVTNFLFPYSELLRGRAVLKFAKPQYLFSPEIIRGLESRPAAPSKLRLLRPVRHHVEEIVQRLLASYLSRRDLLTSEPGPSFIAANFGLDDELSRQLAIRYDGPCSFEIDDLTLTRPTPPQPKYL